MINNIDNNFKASFAQSPLHSATKRYISITGAGAVAGAAWGGLDVLTRKGAINNKTKHIATSATYLALFSLLFNASADLINKLTNNR